MSTELVPINISKDLITKIGVQYNDLFSKIRIFGTIYEPLFVAKDVEKELNLGNLHIRDRDGFKENLHFVRMKLPTTGGVQSAIALTEFGLYKAMFSSEVDLAEQYCQFIVATMKELRTYGVVTLEKALEGTKKDIAVYQKKILALDNTTDDQHEKIELLESRESAAHCSLLKVVRENEELSQKLRDLEFKIEKTENVEYTTTLEKALMKPVGVYLMQRLDDDDEDPQEDDYYTYKLSVLPVSNRKKVMDILMLNPKQQIAELKIHTIQTTLIEIRELVDTSNQRSMKPKV